MFDKLKRLFSNPTSPISSVGQQLPATARTSNDEAAEAYTRVRKKLLGAKGFHVVHYFTYDVRNPRDYTYRLEGNAVAWNIIHFQFFGHPRFDGEWITKSNHTVNSLAEVIKVTDEYRLSHITGNKRDQYKFFYYRKGETGWQLESTPAPWTAYSFLPFQAEEIISFDIFGHRLRATRDIEYVRDEEFEGEACKLYEWVLEAGGYYEFWVSKRTRDLVCLQQTMPHGSAKTVFSKIDEPVEIEEPE